ncbi:hypothetical protein CSUI_007857 [Cystoisospora suis]|uniref:Uncharacterized protein n=1 Tax=Cystoisospora suis TaxID=483139 RepID=A0A2C6KP81_9APIC|nr:hypothetical protein CSUI_007857 [Cystoisospora suis]
MPSGASASSYGGTSSSSTGLSVVSEGWFGAVAKAMKSSLIGMQSAGGDVSKQQAAGQEGRERGEGGGRGRKVQEGGVHYGVRSSPDDSFSSSASLDFRPNRYTTQTPSSSFSSSSSTREIAPGGSSREVVPAHCPAPPPPPPPLFSSSSSAPLGRQRGRGSAHIDDGNDAGRSRDDDSSSSNNKVFYDANDSIHAWVEDDNDISADTWDALNGDDSPSSTLPPPPTTTSSSRSAPQNPPSSFSSSLSSSSSAFSANLPSSSSSHRQPHYEPPQKPAGHSLSLNSSNVTNVSIAFSASPHLRSGGVCTPHPQASPGLILKPSSHLPPNAPGVSLSVSNPPKNLSSSASSLSSSSSSTGLLTGGLVISQEAKKNATTKKGDVSSLLSSGDNFFDEIEKQLMSDEF